MRRRARAPIVVALWIALIAAWPTIARGGAMDETWGKGPWRAQIVDAETKQPLEGVVVLAIWNERYPSPGGWAGGGYFDSEEVVTGADGRFTIRRPKTSLNPITMIKRPEFYIFKAGYGRWRFQGEPEWKDLWWEERERQYQEALQRFNSEAGVVLEMLPLKTHKDRVEFIGGVRTPMPDVPRDRVQRYLHAIDDERVTLGLDQPQRRKPEHN